MRRLLLIAAIVAALSTAVYAQESATAKPDNVPATTDTMAFDNLPNFNVVMMAIAKLRDNQLAKVEERLQSSTDEQLIRYSSSGHDDDLCRILACGRFVSATEVRGMAVGILDKRKADMSLVLSIAALISSVGLPILGWAIPAFLRTQRASRKRSAEPPIDV